jgi:pimeloyl-ACP methyl ester carboxylesterase
MQARIRQTGVFAASALALIVGFAVTVFAQTGSATKIGQESFFDSNGVRIRFMEEGSGEPVVLVHGYTSTAEGNWVAPGVFQRLAKNYRVIALDCRGHGKSAKPHDAKQYGREMALDIVRLLDHLKIQKAHIVGYSMGGNITANLLTMRPERFLTATLGGSGGRLAPTEAEIKRNEMVAAEMEQGSIRTLALSLAPAGQPAPTDAQLTQGAASLLAGQDLFALAAVMRGTPEQVFTVEQAAAVSVPTMAIIGTADPTIEKVNRLKKAMPKLTVVAIEGATHAGSTAAMMRPEFIQALLEFFKAHSTGR